MGGDVGRAGRDGHWEGRREGDWHFRKRTSYLSFSFNRSVASWSCD